MKSSVVIRFAAVAMLAALAWASPAAAQLYMADQQEYEDPDTGDETEWSSLYTLNPANGAATLVGRVQAGGLDIELEDIAYNPLTGTMYGVTYLELYTLDFQNPSGGVVPATLVGSISGMDYSGNVMRGLTVSLDGTLYGGTSYGAYAASPGSLYAIDPATAAATQIGLLGTEAGRNLHNWALGMDDTGTLYGAVYTVENLDSWLATINPLTGAATTIGAIPWSMYAMTFADGSLYGGAYDGGEFYLIDPATGATTLLGTNGLDMFGLTSVPSAVPVPGAAALALFGLTTAAGWLRKRK